jgi:hypothetical protein
MPLISLPQDVPTLGERLHNAVSVTPSLIAEIVRKACRRFPSQSQAARTERFEQLIALGAWTDAALALIELELPQWQVRRLAYDDGEWYCALSRTRDMPDWLDQSVESRHADMALAILSAFVEVRQLGADTERTSVPRAPRHTDSRYEPMLTDNFA